MIFSAPIEFEKRAAKLTQAQASYQDEPFEGEQCSGCAMYVAPGGCTDVRGPISPAGWCRLWERRQETKMGKIDFSAFVKESPGVGDVHSATALGNQKPKARRFREVMDEQAKRRNPHIGVLHDTDVQEGHFDPPDVAAKIAARLARLAERRGEIDKADAPRHLRPKDDKTAHSPFPHDANALANIRPDQVPRFLGAMTDQDRLETRRMALGSLVAMQDRVDPEKVQAMRDSPPGKPPLVVRNGGRNIIADGHHRLAAMWLNGDKQADVKFLDLSAVDNAVKRVANIPCEDCGAKDGEEHKADCPAMTKTGEIEWEGTFKIAKVQPDKQFVFGWASVTHIDGELVIDKQNDIILLEEELEPAAYEFVLNCRSQGDMHEEMDVGKMIESIVYTPEKAEKCGLYAFDPDTGAQMFGWWAGFYTVDKAVWARIRDGALPEFSIGGRAIRSLE